MAYSMILAIYIYMSLDISFIKYPRIHLTICISVYLWDAQYDIDKGISYGT